jgi:hypothetical protein
MLSRSLKSSLLAAAVVLAGAPSLLAQSEPPTFYGIYPQGSFYDATAAQEMQAINAWVGSSSKNMALGGTFLDIEWQQPDFNVPAVFNGIWNAGAVPFANIAVGHWTPGRTMAQVAQGAIDTQIRAFADAYRNWAASGGGKRAFLAPFQEMNGYWVSYGLDPLNYKAAVARIQTIFTQQGVPRNSVRWVFAPNGWSPPGHEWEKYYPGNSKIDVLGFSAYNFGACTPTTTWDPFEVAMKPYLDRMRVMAPSKPIFISQTASVALGGDKSAWLDDTFTKLGAYPAVRGIMYFHLNRYEGLACDPVEWRFYVPGVLAYPGIVTALYKPAAGFGYWAPTNASWTSIAFTSGPGGNTFEDVEQAHPFAGVPTVYYYNSVERLVAANVTGGCGGTPVRYCPEDVVTRGQMAVYLLRAREGPSYTPPACTAPVFNDVPCSNGFASWINELVARGVTGGCGGGNYCPNSAVTREQMAVLLLKTRFGPTYTPPACSNPTFSDVPCSNPFSSWIYALVAQGVTSGCGGGAYCPTSPVGRGQMAVFVVSNFGL